jgi:predicted peptidase
MSRTLALLMLMAAPIAFAQAPAPGAQVPQTFHYDGPGTLAVNYLLYLPEGYDGVGEWPLLLFLHGAGERGEDVDRVAIHGPPRLIREGHALPFIVASPQLPTGHYWQPGTLHALLDDLLARYPVDPARVYVTGLSLGGYGAWALAMDRPGRFAALAPVCGGGDVTRVCRLRDLPVWTFHGAQDTVIPLQRSEELVEALEACGGDARLTVYPEAGHDAWTETYADPALYEWLLGHALRE